MKRSVALLLGLLGTCCLATPARASWTTSPSGSGTALATTIEATGTLTSACGGLNGSVRLNWTATSTPWADGYEVRWGTTSGGPHTSSATTTLLTYTTPSLALGTYYFVVQATKGSWRSVNSNQVSRTIVSVLGIGTCL